MSDRIAWADDEAQQSAEQQRVSCLIGRRLSDGRYFEIAYPSRTPQWQATGFHTLDFGLELDFTDGSTWSFVWQQAGQNEALLAYEGTLVGDQLRGDGDFAIWPLTNIPEWHDAIGQTVTEVNSAWEDFGAQLCPVTLLITFGEDLEICLTLGTEHDGRFRGSHDDIAVFVGLTAARDVGVTMPKRVR